jgi:hypothetical protein
MQPRRVPESFIQIEPDLLIVTEYWDHAPMPKRHWIDEGIGKLKAMLEDEPWTRWDQADWINALVFVGVGLAVLGNVATFIAEVRRASTVG